MVSKVMWGRLSAGDKVEMKVRMDWQPQEGAACTVVRKAGPVRRGTSQGG